MDSKEASSSKAVIEDISRQPNLSWTVSELREFLKKCGGRLKGRKSELVDREVQSSSLSLQGTVIKSFPFIFLCHRAVFYSKNEDAARTKASAKLVEGKTVIAERNSPTFPTSGWSCDASKLPVVTAATVLGHLMRTGKHVSESGDVAVVQKPLRRGHDFFYEGYVHDVQVASVDDKKEVFVVSKCWASQKKYLKYSQKVLFVPDEASNGPAKVKFATCQGCPAGEQGGVCQHIFALLMAVEHLRPLHGHGGSLPPAESVTSRRRLWGPKARDVEPRAIFQCVLERSTGETRRGKGIGSALHEARGHDLRSLSHQDVEELRSDSAKLNCRLLTSLAFESVQIAFGASPEGGTLSYQLQEEPAVADPPPMKRRYRVDDGEDEDDDDGLSHVVVFPPLPLSLPQTTVLKPGGREWPIDLCASRALEARTRQQSNNKEWRSMHKSVITSSNFGKVFRSKDPSRSFLVSLFDSDLKNIPAIQHGKKHEPTAVKAYLQKKSSDGKQVHHRQCGLVLHPQFRFLGASPDGLVSDAGDHGLLEVKCPHTAYVEKKTVYAACLDHAHFCCGVTDGVVKLKRTHHYYCQVQGQMAICGAEWCDFFVWVGNDHFLERIGFNKQFWAEELLPKLLMFYSSSALPYLQEKGRPNVASSSTPQQGGPTDDVHQFEEILPHHLCQSRIADRNGSSACTVICSMFIQKALSADQHTLLSDTDALKAIMCESMLDGNNLYDEHGHVGCLSMDEVLDTIDELHVCMAGESFVFPRAIQTLVDLLHQSAMATPVKRSGGVLVVHPFSFALFCCETTLVVFDSHSHGRLGALIARVPVTAADAYLRYFFRHHYHQLRFDEDSGTNVAGHLTLLRL